ncbi:hypothetical protein GGR57DRAFT_498988 [Xylariaceae sp. FL1272]|nr:hypothetical protein GGR57DRAFT_498988 [Xylariaceae sp. FL1272]
MSFFYPLAGVKVPVADLFLNPSQKYGTPPEDKIEEEEDAVRWIQLKRLLKQETKDDKVFTEKEVRDRVAGLPAIIHNSPATSGASFAKRVLSTIKAERYKREAEELGQEVPDKNETRRKQLADANAMINEDLQRRVEILRPKHPGLNRSTLRKMAMVERKAERAEKEGADKAAGIKTPAQQKKYDENLAKHGKAYAEKQHQVWLRQQKRDAEKTKREKDKMAEIRKKEPELARTLTHNELRNVARRRLTEEKKSRGKTPALLDEDDDGDDEEWFFPCFKPIFRLV